METTRLKEIPVRDLVPGKWYLVSVPGWNLEPNLYLSWWNKPYFNGLGGRMEDFTIYEIPEEITEVI